MSPIWLGEQNIGYAEISVMSILYEISDYKNMGPIWMGEQNMGPIWLGEQNI